MPQMPVTALKVGDALVAIKPAAVAASSGGVALADAPEPLLEHVALTTVQARRADPPTPLYNLMLDGDHTYFANGFLVYNKL